MSVRHRGKPAPTVMRFLWERDLPAIECAALARCHRIYGKTCNCPNEQPYRVIRQRRIERINSHSSKITTASDAMGHNQKANGVSGQGSRTVPPCLEQARIVHKMPAMAERCASKGACRHAILTVETHCHHFRYPDL